jgi:hypothetical protein
MSEPVGGKVRVDQATYRKNRDSFPLAELARYGEQWVAWSADGSRIVAHDEDLVKVADSIRAAGIDAEDVMFEYIPPGGEVETLL